MTLMGKSNSLGGSICAYHSGTILFDGYDGASESIMLKKGCYYIRGQGAGAGGGNCGLGGLGGGGGSGAGFEGNIYISHSTDNITCYAGIAVQANRQNGEASYIGDLISMGGGFIGGTENSKAGAGGILSISEDIKILSYQIKSDGNPGNQSDDGSVSRCGGDSVLTNSGGGIYKGNFEERCASAPGAGGAGGKDWDNNGGYGKSGEVKIQYLRPKP